MRAVNYFDPDAKFNPLLMTWSLGVEEQFYLIFPWLILLILKRRKDHLLLILSCATAVSFGLSLWCTTYFPPAAFYLSTAGTKCARWRRKSVPVWLREKGREALVS